MRPLILSVLLLGSIGFAHCSTADRLDADTRACNWRPASAKFVDVYSEMDQRLVKTGISKDDPARLYSIISEEVGYWVRRSQATHTHISVILSSLMQFELSKDLDRRDCFDHCTFVLAKNNCNSAMHLHACRPRSIQQDSYIKSMLDTKVFALIDRCQLPLMYQALVLNTTDISPQLYKTVSLIAERMIDPNIFSRWGSIESMLLISKRPFFNTRRLVSPGETRFFDEIAQLMIDAERAGGGNQLFKDIETGQVLAPAAKHHFHRLVIQPCLEFIHKMRTTMDATIFYGRISESDSKLFQKVDMSSALRVHYFELVRLYEACVYLDNAKYTINWRYEAHRLLSNDQLPSMSMAEYKRSRGIPPITG